jgi:hypothetical protein
MWLAKLRPPNAFSYANCVLDARKGPVYEAPRGDIGRDGRQGIQACAKLRRHWAPITAVVLAVVFVVAA